jgi:hypothetical protein
MMDDETLGIDLDAWQPPPPPAGIADRVLARMREETTNILPQALPIDPDRPSTRRWWLVGGAIVAAAAVAVVVFGMTRAPASGSGQLVATQPAHLALGPSSADLDARTVVTWRRAKYRITAQQAGGAAQWRVDAGDTLTIETALGSIEATNASLRVEVKMLDEKKTIALSAVTAAAVAVVTIIVYEGTVRVREPDVSHEVRAGTTYQIKAKGDNVIEVEESVVGAAPVEPDLTREHVKVAMDSVKNQIRACADRYNGKLSALVIVDGTGKVTSVTMTPSDAAPTECVARWLGRTKFAATKNGGKFRYPFLFTVPRCDVDELLAVGVDALTSQDPERAVESFEAAHACAPSMDTLKRVFLMACKVKNTTRARELYREMDEQSQAWAISTCANNGVYQETLTDEPERGHVRRR